MLLLVKYAVVASLVVWLSIKASKYIDMLDKTTKLSGAFLGGVLLSAVTSLPELFTSISATVLLKKPSLCIGNILGSDIFNLAILALLGMVAIRSFGRATISRGNILVTAFVAAIYGALILNWFNILNFEIATINIVTILMVVLYAVGVRFLASDTGKKCEDGGCVALSVGQIAVRFVAASVGIVALSVLMTYITDDIAKTYNIGMGMAGAIFLGVATSLPEVSSTIALFRMKSYDIAVGNIVGSNLFNFLVLCIADVLCIGQSVYDYTDANVVNLLVFGSVATVAALYALIAKKSGWRFVGLAAVVACYFAFLLAD